MQAIHTEVFKAGQSTGLAAVLIHGASDHSARYRHVIETLNAGGIDVISGDLPGFGRSKGLHGHIDRFGDYLEAVDGWVREAERVAGAAGRVVMIGHSMGGLVAVRYLQEYGAQRERIIGAALSSPLLRVAVEIPAWKRQIAKVLDRAIPKLRMPSGISTAYLTRNQEVVAQYELDPLCGGVVSARWYAEIQRAMELAKREAGKIAVPILLLQAGADRIVAPEEAEPFFRTLPERENNKFLCYGDCYHELFNEPEQDVILAELLEWVAKL
ncbi:lysophospholipase [Tumebacillus sp. BK434]|uniref:alpha/beta hydrolase n=1 Tax=Tumebacillus sp. BK434 TaxID=2512169 RepID=UPI0010E8DA13|nr:alpha/beta hydrolase [Tumebacillus sp. BK434]TCP52424.1 lysophospholipase [Tumebacillus sp. BK434]